MAWPVNGSMNRADSRLYQRNLFFRRYRYLFRHCKFQKVHHFRRRMPADLKYRGYWHMTNH